MMVSVASDFSVVGTVLALAIAILLLSGLALYVAFRLRETLRDTKGGGARAAKVALLIGLLFLSGGVFYFFASGFGGFGGPNTSTTTASTSTLSSSSSSSSTSQSTSQTSSSTSTTTASSSAGSVSMQLSYPSSANVGQGFYLTVSIFNSGSTTFSGASVDIGSMTFSFTIRNATVCAPSCQSTTWYGGVVNVGNLAPGSTVLTIGLKAPSSPSQFSGQATLSYIGQSQSFTLPISIRVSGRP